jgi:hypothetical protein
VPAGVAVTTIKSVNPGAAVRLVIPAGSLPNAGGGDLVPAPRVGESVTRSLRIAVSHNALTAYSNLGIGKAEQIA